MAPVLVLTEKEIRECAPMDGAALAAIERAFVWLSEGRVEAPPIMHIAVEENNGDVDIKSAFVRGEPSIAVKVAAGFFDNPKQGLPSSSAMVVAVSARTGRCEAVLLDNAYLTDLRTGLAGAVAAKYLARKDSSTVGIVGAGVQARFQARALALVRPISRIYVSARSREQLEAYQAEMADALGIPVEICPSLEDVARRSDVIVTTTPSKEAIIQAGWLRPGQHLTAMGADLPGKQELDPDVLARADLIVCDDPRQSRTHGELQHVTDETALKSAPVALGDLARRVVNGRTGDDQITVCDLSGLGVQDTAITLHVLRAARERGLGQIFDS